MSWSLISAHRTHLHHHSFVATSYRVISLNLNPSYYYQILVIFVIGVLLVKNKGALHNFSSLKNMFKKTNLIWGKLLFGYLGIEIRVFDFRNLYSMCAVMVLVWFIDVPPYKFFKPFANRESKMEINILVSM